MPHLIIASIIGSIDGCNSLNVCLNAYRTSIPRFKSSFWLRVYRWSRAKHSSVSCSCFSDISIDNIFASHFSSSLRPIHCGRIVNHIEHILNMVNSADSSKFSYCHRIWVIHFSALEGNITNVTCYDQTVIKPIKIFEYLFRIFTEGFLGKQDGF